MTSLPSSFSDFIQENHVLSLSVCNQDAPWAANAFYCFDPKSISLIFLSHTESQHSKMLLENSHVAGTIAGQPVDVSKIVGVQFYGLARIIEQADEQQSALELYLTRFPHVPKIAAPLWRIQLLKLKLTDNRTSFGSKTLWERQDVQP